MRFDSSLVTNDSWCNGNTSDFGTVNQGSSPCESTNLKLNIMSYSLKQVLMQRDGMTGAEATQEIKNIRSRVFEGENPETILYEEYRLELDYIWDLL